MNCIAAQDQLGRYVDGELPEADVAALEQHLVACPTCTAELNATRLLVSRIQRHEATEPITVPDFIWSRVEQRLAGDVDPPRQATVLFHRLRRRMAMAAGFAVLIGAGVLVAIWANRTTGVAQANTIDYRLLLDGINKDADKAVERFLQHYRAVSMEPDAIVADAATMNLQIPRGLPGGYSLEKSYRLRFGPNAGYAARYRRGDEPVFVCFHRPVEKTLMGVHRQSHCALAKGSYCVEAGAWQLIHFTDPTTCHCLLSRSTNEQELHAMLAAISPGLTASQPSR